MEQECKLELNHIDEQPVVEEIILPEHSLTLEKINTERIKKKHTKTKHKIKREKCGEKDDDDDDEDDDEALYADDNGSETKDDDDDKNSERESKCEQDEEVLELEAADDALVVKTAGGSNSFAASKNVAQGMMDIALITANANQLRYILAYNKGSSTYYVNVFLVSASLFLQISVGICLILKGRYKKDSDPKTAKQLSNFIVIGVFLITIINVFIASFTVTTDDTKSSET